MRTTRLHTWVIYGLCAAFLGSLIGCATEQVTVTTGKHYSVTNPNLVVIYQTNKPKKPYQEIGTVSVSKHNNIAIARSGAEIDRLIKEKAASVGGNAVLLVSEDFASVSGVVIRTR